jgi:polyisoprenoid-binding protein YceI
MKSITKLITLFTLVFAALSFTTIEETKKEVNVNDSTITWKGYSLTGSHEGTIALKSGHLNFEDNTLTGGTFTIDMTSINVTDIQGDYKAKLEGHLNSDDFFGTANYPTASLVFTKVDATANNTYQITGDITIKGQTESITFTMTVNPNKANAALKLDRTKFGVKYASASFFEGLKDKAINDEFDLVANLKF